MKLHNLLKHIKSALRSAEESWITFTGRERVAILLALITLLIGLISKFIIFNS